MKLTILILTYCNFILLTYKTKYGFRSYFTSKLINGCDDVHTGKLSSETDNIKA